MNALIRYLVILPLLAFAIVLTPQVDSAEAQCLRVSRGTVSLRKVGSRHRMYGRNFYFNMTCSGRIRTGNATLSSGVYCVGTRIGNASGGRCRITSIYLLRAAQRAMTLSSSTNNEQCWKAE